MTIPLLHNVITPSLRGTPTASGVLDGKMCIGNYMFLKKNVL